MDNYQAKNLKTALTEIRNSMDEGDQSKLDLDLYEKVIDKVASYAVECDECKEYLIEMEVHIAQIQKEITSKNEINFKLHKQKVNEFTSHLTNQHNLVTEGYYLSIYMAIGTGIGLPFGLLLFDNIALGLPIGIGIGVAIGAGLDADAKEKGKVI
ncbi:hypothetical protein [Halalkalibacillus halophilus]|uniref:hypothetical protein n=1 Tax=Halalkalibacillus halophilus TaxID=392827 RepID=UPI000418E92C|nr:hypothetical protein [Halalkalibacillus halophilus]